MNQETELKRASDTRWNSHYQSIVNLILLCSSVIVALDSIEDISSAERREVVLILEKMRTFEFAFSIHLMRNILGITSELSLTLQRKNQNIVNVMDFLKMSKQRFQEMRCDGWESFLTEISSFSAQHNIEVPKMDDIFILTGRSRRNTQSFSNLHHYRYDLFNTVIDLQVQELNNHFTKANIVTCVACLNLSGSF